MQQQTEQKSVFLEVRRMRDFNPKSGAAGERQMRYAAWCQRCQGKVNLVSKNEASFKNMATGVLHVQLVFAGKLLVCQNSLNQKSERNQ